MQKIGVPGGLRAMPKLFFHCADDPVLMPSGQPAVFGKNTIRPLYQSVLKEYLFKSQTRLMDIEVSGDLGYFWSTYKLTATPKAERVV